MRPDKVRKFMQLAGQAYSKSPRIGSEAERKLGAQLLLSEVLEYVVHGLGIFPEFQGTKITKPDDLSYSVAAHSPDPTEMLDGLADTAYTMYWNSEAFGLPLEEAYDQVCDNNLSKFVKLNSWTQGERELTTAEWNCGQAICWPKEVVRVHVVRVDNEYYAVGKDERGKVRKPSSYQRIDLSGLLGCVNC